MPAVESMFNVGRLVNPGFYVAWPSPAAKKFFAEFLCTDFLCRNLPWPAPGSRLLVSPGRIKKLAWPKFLAGNKHGHNSPKLETWDKANLVRGLDLFRPGSGRIHLVYLTIKPGAFTFDLGSKANLRPGDRTWKCSH